MSPGEALQSPVALFYGAVTFGLLPVAGVVLAVLRWGLQKNVDRAWQAFRGWLVMIPLIAVAIFLGRETAIVFFTVVGLLAFNEFARATALNQDRWLMGGVSLGIISLGVVALNPNEKIDRCNLYMVMPLFVTAGLLTIPIILNRFAGQVQSLGLAILGFVLCGWMFGHVSLLANSKHAYSLLLFLLFAVELSDVAAFVTGKLFGRHALRSNISPEKTWEGTIGALAVSLALPWVLRSTFPDFTAMDLIAIGLIVGIGGQVGDLAFSVIKRDLGFKDFGNSIPGHGGILDRIDSLILVAPFYFHYIWIRHANYFA